VVFAFVHLVLLLGVVAYAVISFVQRNPVRGVLILLSLAIYYWAVLHSPVKKEIERRREQKKARITHE